MDRKLILLSDGLKKILKAINWKYKCQIVEDLLCADSLISMYNNLCDDSQLNDIEYVKKMKLLSNKINSIVTDYARMLSCRYNTFEISYLPKDTKPAYISENRWSRSNRVSAKPSRIIQKLLVNKYNCKDFENFNNWFKASIIDVGEFKIVSGSDITKYYLEDNYYSEVGSLGNSCMRYSKCQPYFKVYEDFAKMLVYLKGDKLLGRALLWEIDGKTYMDRIYVCMDYLENQFRAYAESNKWFYRSNNSTLCDGDEIAWWTPDNNYICPKWLKSLKIEIGSKYDYLPYMDTFRYYFDYRSDKAFITTCPNQLDADRICLSSTNGSFMCNEPRVWTCWHCGHEVVGDDYYPNEFRYSAWLDCDLCVDCAVYLDSIEDYVSIDTPLVDVFMDSTTTLKYPLDWCKEYSLQFTCINNKWYSITSTIDKLIEFDKKQNCYKLKDE